jgi:hypothetical protein
MCFDPGAMPDIGMQRTRNKRSYHARLGASRGSCAPLMPGVGLLLGTEPGAVATGSKRCPVETTQPLISPAKAGAGFMGALIPGLRSLRSLTPG